MFVMFPDALSLRMKIVLKSGDIFCWGNAALERCFVSQLCSSSFWYSFSIGLSCCKALDVAALPLVSITALDSNVPPTTRRVFTWFLSISLNPVIKIRQTQDALIGIDDFCGTYFPLHFWMVHFNVSWNRHFTSQTTSTTLIATGSTSQSTLSAAVYSLLFAIELLMYRRFYQ